MKKRFTLVELLVVIAILSILASLLMPTLSKARAQAQKICCMSNLRQSAALWSEYSNDNSGYLIPVNLQGSYFKYYYTYLGYSSVPVKLYPELPEKTIMVCPSNPALSTGAATLPWVYSINYNIVHKHQHGSF